MYKSVISLLLLLAFSAQTFSSPFIMLGYYANTAAYAKDCINKAKPRLHCKGKCQAMKKIQEEEKKEQQNNEQLTAAKTQVLSSKSFFSLLIIPRRTSSRILSYEITFSLTDRSLAIFHPPQL